MSKTNKKDQIITVPKKNNIKQKQTESKSVNYSDSFYLSCRLAKEYLLPNYKMFMVSVILMIIVALTTSAHAWLIKPALDAVFIGKKSDMLLLIPLAVFGVTVIKGFSTYFQLLSMNIVILKITSNMRTRVYNHFIRSDIAKLHNKSSGDMIMTITNEINSITAMISTVINGFVKQFFTLGFLIILMFKQSLELSLVSFIGFPLAAYPIYKIGRKLRNLSYKNQEMSQKFASQMNDTLQYSKLVKSYNCEDYEVKRMDLIIDGIFKMGKKMSRLALISSPFTETMTGVGVAAVIWYGGKQVVEGITTPGAFFSFIGALMMAYRPLKSVSGMNSGVQLGLAAATRLYSLLDEKPKVVDKPNAVELKNPQGNITFEKIKFSYIADKIAINDLSFEVKAGQKIALVGHSGGGKSTIMSLLLRFYDPQEGVIKIDGHDICNLTISSLRSAMSVVNQEVMLFDDIVMENIRYGKIDASEEEIINAAKLAEADQFIKELPLGYNTQIGQNGIRLSGGQRQRIAIARAILYNAPILLLDEATSALDPISERAIKEALDNLTKNRTTLIIAHRLSTVIYADKILVINEGRVIESGTHKELLDKSGSYANLYSKQFDIQMDK
jgi:subfamily B ATP-binding cassette protein MsbA